MHIYIYIYIYIQYIEDVGSYFDISFFQSLNLSLMDADSHSEISFLKFQT